MWSLWLVAVDLQRPLPSFSLSSLVLDLCSVCSMMATVLRVVKSNHSKVQREKDGLSGVCCRLGFLEAFAEMEFGVQVDYNIWSRKGLEAEPSKGRSGASVQT